MTISCMPKQNPKRNGFRLDVACYYIECIPHQEKYLYYLCAKSTASNYKICLLKFKLTIWDSEIPTKTGNSRCFKNSLLCSLMSSLCVFEARIWMYDVIRHKSLENYTIICYTIDACVHMVYCLFQRAKLWIGYLMIGIFIYSQYK